MCCVKSWWIIALILLLAGCGGMADDLNPSSKDERPEVIPGAIGYMPGQIAADFSLTTSTGSTFQLSDYLADGEHASDAVVLYFTMWCPVCLAHSDHIYSEVIPHFKSRGTVAYVLVDYVSGSVAVSRAQERSNGYAGSDFTTLVDSDLDVMDQFNAAMGTVVVIATDGSILLNEDYRNGVALNETLNQLLP